ncbi:MAG: SAM-dependent methyltransferase [Pseudomonadota bacterium]
MMTPLENELLRQIAQTGPITIAEYMTHCLLHPKHGYYSQAEPFGRAGDFITAPEISQMFGELIGLAIAQAWLDQGSPNDIFLVELGPGRGTLMADILRATKKIAGFADAIQIALIEMSARQKAVQRETLSDYAVRHFDRLSDVPDGPIFVVANEYFDCLPIHQFGCLNDAWHEIVINSVDGRLAFALGPQQGWSTEGDFVETCPAALSDMIEIDQRIAQRGGAAIIIDYGDWGSSGDTLQAIKGHQKVSPLALPGQSDLTAHVDFKPLAGVIEHSQVSRLTPQGVFLERLGITKRAQTLSERLSGQALDAHIAGHRRLVHPDEMGQLFKVLGITPSGTPMIAGLAI